MTEFEMFTLGTSDGVGYEGMDGKDADADAEEEALQANDGSMQNVEGWGHSWFDLGTSDVSRCEGVDGEDMDEDEVEIALQSDDGSTQNEEDTGHSIGEWEDWTLGFRPVKYDNGEANATASDVSEAKTVL